MSRGFGIVRPDRNLVVEGEKRTRVAVVDSVPGTLRWQLHVVPVRHQQRRIVSIQMIIGRELQVQLSVFLIVLQRASDGRLADRHVDHAVFQYVWT